MDEGCTNLMGFGFTGSPTKYTRIQLSLIMGSQSQSPATGFKNSQLVPILMVGHDEENTEDGFPIL